MRRFGLAVLGVLGLALIVTGYEGVLCIAPTLPAPGVAATYVLALAGQIFGIFAIRASIQEWVMEQPMQPSASAPAQVVQSGASAGPRPLTDQEVDLVLYSEWLDADLHLIKSTKQSRDKRSHLELVRAFIEQGRQKREEVHDDHAEAEAARK